MPDPKPILTVHADGAALRLAVPSGQSVREALDATALRVPAACDGTGACGSCVVRLLSGAAAPPSPAEARRLTAVELAGGLRLACQLRLTGDAALRLERTAPPSPWRSIPPAELPPSPDAGPRPAAAGLGLAVDLGTTTVRVSLWDRRRVLRVAAREGPNPQARSGADVLSRLGAASRGAEPRAELARQARAAILEGAGDILARELGQAPAATGELTRLVVVGNSAMLALLTGTGAPALLRPEAWQEPADCRPADEAAWRAAWRLPGAEVVIAPPLAGFVGSDLAAALLECGLSQGKEPALLLDVGTNTELALWDGAALWIASAPGGPAFEGCGSSRGMAAGPGAVEHVRRDGGAYACAVMGGGEPQGFCGSGLVDAVALLLRDGLLKPSGRFAAQAGSGGVLLQPGSDRARLRGADVDVFQRAKAATAAGAALLLAKADLHWTDLARLCLCGAFGRTLDLDHARAVGLLPPVPDARIELRGQAALAGCERALLAPDPAALLADAAPRPRPVRLSTSEFDDLFVRHLRLEPLPAR